MPIQSKYPVQHDSQKQRVVIVGVDIPFLDLLTSLVKLTFAAIPAVFFFMVLHAFFGAILQGLSS